MDGEQSFIHLGRKGRRGGDGGGGREMKITESGRNQTQK